MKKYIIASSLLFVLIVILSACGYFLYQKMNFKPIKCALKVKYDFFDKHLNSPILGRKMEDETLYFILDERKKIILDLEKNPKNDIKITKVDENTLNFGYDNKDKGKSDFSINRNTGEIVGLEYIKSPEGDTFFDYKGTCEPYKIEKKF